MSIKNDVQKQFGQSASLYVESSIHKHGKDLEQLLTLAKPTGTEQVLDIATGAGHTANAFAPFVKAVTAIDLTKEMLIQAEKFIKANKHQNVTFKLADAEKLPLANESFHIVTCRIAPHHFPNVEAFIQETYRVLTSGGKFLLVDNIAPEEDNLDKFYNTVEKMRDYSHFRAWKQSEWTDMLEGNGFAIKEVKSFNKTFEFNSWCNRMKLSSDEIEQLTLYMLNASEEAKNHFRIKMAENTITSFDGEAIIIKAIKR